MQREQHYTVTFRPMFIDIMLSGMETDSFKIVDLGKFGLCANLPKTFKSIRDHTERQYCGKSSKFINDAYTIMIDREKVAYFLILVHVTYHLWQMKNN